MMVTAATASRSASMTNATPSSPSEEMGFATAAATTASSTSPMASRTRPGRAPELVSAMIAVRPATAIAATLPPHPCGGSVIVTTNVVRIRTRTSP